MTIQNTRGLSPYDSDSGSNEALEKYFPLILALARQEVPVSIGPVDSEDVAQEAFIKLLLSAKKQPIESPKAYIRKIVHTVKIDIARKYKPNLNQAFPTDENGEISEDSLSDVSGMGLNNPETLLEEEEAVEERMQEIVTAIATFHPRQRRATICTLRDRVDDLLQFVDALSTSGIDSEAQWPAPQPDRQRLQASYAPARRKIAQRMGVNLADY